MPDGLDLLVICAEAGLGLDAALTCVARDFGWPRHSLPTSSASPRSSWDFSPTGAWRCRTWCAAPTWSAIRGVVNTLVQTERYGTPLAQALRVLAAEFREERMLRAEEKAARLPAILTVPMIIFILPTLFVVLMVWPMVRVAENFLR